MRITNTMLVNNSIADMNSNLQRMQVVQEQMTSGKLYQKPSDNPTAVTRSMQLKTSLASNTQYASNISDTSNFLSTTDTALGQAGDVIQNIRQLMVSSGTAGQTASDNLAINNSINQDVAQFAQILDTNFGGKYIFGGTSANTKPVDAITTASVAKSNSASPDITVSGNFTGSTNTAIAVKVTAVDPSTSTATLLVGDEKTGTSININIYTGTVTANGMIVCFPASTNIKDLKVNDTYTISCPPNGNTELVYCDSTGAAVPNPSTSLSSKLQVGISQGVAVTYSATATDIMGGTSSTSGAYDLRQIFTNIINHLNGNVDDGTGTGTLKSDPAAAQAAIAGGDLTDIDTAMNKILSVRSQVGAMSNRMSDAADQNTAQNDSITNLLSTTRDTDITKATIEFASLQSVFLASIQTSAKIIQPSLLDYLK